MVKNLLGTVALLLSATAMRADVFSFSYAGTYFGSAVSAAGTLVANSGAGGIYTVSSLSGVRNGTSISDPNAAKGTFLYGGSGGIGSFSFLIGGAPGKADLVSFLGGLYTETGYTGMVAGTNFSLSRLPEPTTLSLLLTMGLGVWLLARRAPRNTPSS